MTEPSELDLALSDPPVLQSPLPSSFFAALSERIEAALASAQREALQQIGSGLTRIVDAKLRSAPAAVKAALNQAGATVDATYALELGQLTFALQLLTQALQKRAPDEALALALSDSYRPYVQALQRSERTNAELRDIVAEATETISRKLRVLRENGITEFRREGRHIVNFLTPTGWACAESLNEANSEAGAAPADLAVDDSVDVARSIALSALRRAVPPQFSELPILEGRSREQKLYGQG